MSDQFAYSGVVAPVSLVGLGFGFLVLSHGVHLRFQLSVLQCPDIPSPHLHII